jgi:hypothetical protein
MMSMRVTQLQCMLMVLIDPNHVSSVLWRGLIPHIGVLILAQSRNPAICRVVFVVIADCACEQ